MMNKKSIMNALRYANSLANGGYHASAPSYSIDRVQTAVGIIDKLNAPTASVFASQNIVTVGMAHSIMINAYWKTHNDDYLVLANDLRVIKFTGTATYVQYHIIDTPFNSEPAVSCNMLTNQSLSSLIHAVKKNLGLEDNKTIKIPDEMPF